MSRNKVKLTKSTPVYARLSDDVLKALDKWAEDNNLTRSNAISKVVAWALEHEIEL